MHLRVDKCWFLAGGDIYNELWNPAKGNVLNGWVLVLRVTIMNLTIRKFRIIILTGKVTYFCFSMCSDKMVMVISTL